MIAVDTSTFVAYFQGDSGKDIELLDELLEFHQVVLLPVVLTELLSDPKFPKELRKEILSIPQVEFKPGFWVRAGELRAKTLKMKRKAKLADTLIAQICLDYHFTLLTRDSDFRSFSDLKRC